MEATNNYNNNQAIIDDFNPEEALNFIKKAMPSWRNNQLEDVSFTRLTGLTNKTYRVGINQAKDGSKGSADGEKVNPPSVFLRVFEKDGVFFDRTKEMNLINLLYSRKMGPQLYGFEGRYRLEEFYENSRTMKQSEVKEMNFRRRIVYNMAKFHNEIRPDDVEKLPLVEKMYKEGDIIREFHSKVSKERENGNLNELEIEMIREIEQMTTEEEFDFLKSISPKDNENLVFSHNDLIPGNILLINGEKDMVFIDYEYANYNPRGYDLANHFNESIIDYHYPEAPYFKIREENGLNKEEMDDMILNYVIFSNSKLLGLDEKAIQELIEGNDNTLLLELEKNEFVQNECEKLKEEIKACMLMAHAYWIVWSVIMSKNKAIAFDYIKYAHERFKVYQKLKKAWFDYETDDQSPRSAKSI